jgi:hypothetical protein
MGYMQTRTQFELDLSRATKTEFTKGNERLAANLPQFRPVPVHGIGEVAFRSSGGDELDVWQNGLIVSVEGQYLAVYPQKGINLVRLLLQRLK